jgi:hypothetical protein
MLTASEEVEVDGGVEARDADELVFGRHDRLLHPRERVARPGGGWQRGPRQHARRVVDVVVDLPFRQNPERKRQPTKDPERSQQRRDERTGGRHGAPLSPTPLTHWPCSPHCLAQPLQPINHTPSRPKAPAPAPTKTHATSNAPISTSLASQPFRGGTLLRYRDHQCMPSQVPSRSTWREITSPPAMRALTLPMQWPFQGRVAASTHSPAPGRRIHPESIENRTPPDPFNWKPGARCRQVISVEVGAGEEGGDMCARAPERAVPSWIRRWEMPPVARGSRAAVAWRGIFGGDVAHAASGDNFGVGTILVSA